MSYLDARVRAGVVDLRLTAERGETVAVLGPNGAGKTTLLRALAGLVNLTAGDIRVAGRDITRLPPHRRGVGLVPQGHVLLPNLTARGNVAYGLRAHGVGRRDARHRADEWLDRLGVRDLAGRRPRTLSGGQAQRVALARALAIEPGVLLLDEPLAAVDATAAVELRRALREHLASFPGTCLLVTHDPVEAVTLAGRLVVVEDGGIVQDGTPADVLRTPGSRWVARMLGMNAYEGVVADPADPADPAGAADAADVVRIDGGGSVVAVDAPEAGTRVLATIGPEAVALYRTRPNGSPRNTWAGVVGEVSALGGRVRVHVHGTPEIVAEVTPSAAATLELAPAAEIWVSVKATEIRLTPL